ncbi:MAG: WD40 repeat domain-containing protein, partial [Cyanobacteria bacterium J06649_4]
MSNAIYQSVFDDGWIKEHLPVNWVKRLQRARAAIFSLVAITAITVPVSIYAVLQQNRAERQTIRAEANATRAFFLADQPIETLISAVQAAQDTQQLRWHSNDMAVLALANLQQAIYPNRDFILQAPFAFRERNRLADHQDWVYSVSFSPDGNTLASASVD